MDPRVQFHGELAELDKKVGLLFAYVCEDIAAATQALLGSEDDVLTLLTEREDTINDLSEDIEALVEERLAVQAPAASNLRYMLSVFHIAPELERSHDLVMHIAEQGTRIAWNGLTPKTRALLERMSAITVGMWLIVASAWGEGRPSVAEELDGRDDTLDTLHIALMDELAAGHMALPLSLNVARVGRLYERLGDHTVTISRRAPGPQLAMRVDGGSAGRKR